MIQIVTQINLEKIRNIFKNIIKNYSFLKTFKIKQLFTSTWEARLGRSSCPVTFNGRHVGVEA